MFSGSAWDKQELLDYVRKQRTHHQDRTFQAELRDILHATQTPFDEKWVWDQGTFRNPVRHLPVRH